MKRTLAITVLLGLLSIYPGLVDPSSFILAGDDITNPQTVPIRVYPDTPGYDGQFFYHLALDPLNPSQLGLYPEYRHQRILYPLLVRLAALGQRDRVPYTLIVVNYAAALAVAFLAVLLVRNLGRPDWYGLLFVLWPGFYISLTRDLSEIVSAALLLLGLVLVGRGRPWCGAFALSLAILTRETTLIAALVLPLPMALLPLVVYGSWQVALYARWGAFPALSGSANLRWTPALVGAPWYVALALFVFALVVLLSFRRSLARPGLKLAWLTYLLMTLLLAWSVWKDHNAYLRVLAELYILGLIILLHPRNSRNTTASITRAWQSLTRWSRGIIPGVRIRRIEPGRLHRTGRVGPDQEITRAAPMSGNGLKFHLEGIAPQI